MRDVTREPFMRMALVAGSVAAFLAAAEVASRAVERVRPPALAIRQYAEGHFTRHRFLPGDPLGWELLPGPPAYNALGMRDYDYPAAKPAGAYRILVLGDSIAFGHGVDMSETFENQLEGLLRRRIGRPIEILNMAVPGYNTRQELLKFRKDGAALKPDLVLVAYAMNDDAVSPMVFVDGGVVRFEYALQGEANAVPGPAPGAAARAWGAIFLRSSFARYLTYAALRVRMSGRGQDESQTPPGSSSASMRDLAAIRDEAAAVGAKTAVAIFPLLEWTPAGYAHAQRLAQLTAFLDRERIPYVDLLGPLSVHPNASLRVAPGDDLHPNRRGHAVAAAALAAFLGQAFPDIAPGPPGATPRVSRAQELFAGMRPQLLPAPAPAAGGRARFAAVTGVRDATSLYVLMEVAGAVDRVSDYTFWLDDKRDPLVQIHVENGGAFGAYQIHQEGRMLARLTGVVDTAEGVLVTIPRAALPAGFRDAPRVWATGFEAASYRPDGKGGFIATVHDRLDDALEITPPPGAP